VDRAGWWLTPGAPQQVLAWETKHLPHRFAADGSGSSGAPGPAAELFDTFSLPAVYGVLDSRGLLVQAVADGPLTRFSIGGKQQPALAGASGPQILRIAGLPWKIPTI
jgi:hypothetical protein